VAVDAKFWMVTAPRYFGTVDEEKAPQEKVPPPVTARVTEAAVRPT
jgi:hypothetical protein